jgi:membrane protease YdiL (CAAX protease family)
MQEQSTIPFGFLLPFLAVAFGLTWGLATAFVLFPEPIEAVFGELRMTNPLFILAVYAPAIAAFILVAWATGLDGIKRFLSRLLLWRCPAGWYLFLIFGVPVFMYGGAAAKGAVEAFPFSPWHAVFPALATALVIGPVEEFGWRGFALPLLQRRYAPFWAALILGVIWGLWHVPAFLLSGTPQSGWSFGPFFLGAIAIGVIMTPLFNVSRGSILLPALFHFQLNNPIYPDAQPYDTILIAVAAIVVVAIYRKSMFVRDGAVQEVVPGRE